jgi:hypothetical protein
MFFLLLKWINTNCVILTRVRKLVFKQRKIFLHIVESLEVEDFRLPTNTGKLQNKDIDSSVNEARYERSRVDWRIILKWNLHKCLNFTYTFRVKFTFWNSGCDVFILLKYIPDFLHILKQEVPIRGFRFRPRSRSELSSSGVLCSE